jgi:hypothetical protein
LTSVAITSTFIIAIIFIATIKGKEHSHDQAHS